MRPINPRASIGIGSLLFMLIVAVIILAATSTSSGRSSPLSEAGSSPVETSTVEETSTATTLPATATSTATTPPPTQVVPTATLPAPTAPRPTLPPPTPTRPAPTATLAPVQQAAPADVYLGTWQPGAPWNMSALTSFENAVGKKMAIVQWYQGWGADNRAFDPNIVQAVVNHGAMPLITWEPYDYTKGINQPEYATANIAAGNFDAYITSWAQGLKSFGKPVFLRFAHEMNVYTYPWSANANGNSPQSYVAAWRRVHDIFTRVGATNVLWVWSPTVKYEGTVPYANVYPGDAYVDWLALDGYNAGAALPWGGWQSFSQIFTESYRDLTRLSQKPIMIAETASVEQGGSKAAWIADALNSLPQSFPRIRAVVWFNENWYDNSGKNADWRIESSASSLDAFRKVAANPYFKSTMAIGPRN